METEQKIRRQFFKLAFWERPLFRWPALVLAVFGSYDLLVAQLLPHEIGENMPTIYEVVSAMLNISIPWWSWFALIVILVFAAIFELAFRYWRKGSSLESLIYLSSISVEDKFWTDEKYLKFFLRGYNASPFTLEFKYQNGNIFYSNQNSVPRKLPAPILEFPWPHPAMPYTEFGIHVAQTLPSDARQEIEDALEAGLPIRFSFDDLEILVDTVGKKHKSTALDFTKNNWITIDLVRRARRFSVSKVIHMGISAAAKASVNLGGKK
ncbi:MAG: hypothetical protein IH901_03460 [Proteobacteria bacterium]|nr:hypothetical protein [Pseudomonadota bacterium]